ncbi:DUF1345 domain-containing protein [Sphingomonas sp. RG327]|jgi:uncharacterized membrane protein|uniref:DUF1345 domain-containing protein n=1 Tax=Sphingomonas anseongensis TaxID=2908207 RepID=A0ABT0RGD0_9SPHN|nr:DUF1345 domain-containing protein [Sphingomonas anseongensis]MCL6679314.1 DUF1345 domain-containing protein [Sphingomonas anseongensis]
MRKFAPSRFIIFLVLLIAGIGGFVWIWQPLKGIMAGFDLAAFIFLASHLPFLNDTADQMRRHSKENDANRAMLLSITVAVTTVILVTVGAVIGRGQSHEVADVVMVIVTLALAWLFGNTVYALHYAHLYYQAGPGKGGDAAGIEFPATKEPDYWDFLYFAATLGMTFQTSDCDITAPAIRRVVVGHCFAAFIFNLGVLAFTINALGS